MVVINSWVVRLISAGCVPRLYSNPQLTRSTDVGVLPAVRLQSEDPLDRSQFQSLAQPYSKIQELGADSLFKATMMAYHLPHNFCFLRMRILTPQLRFVHLYPLHEFGRRLLLHRLDHRAVHVLPQEESHRHPLPPGSDRLFLFQCV